MKFIIDLSGIQQRSVMVNLAQKYVSNWTKTSIPEYIVFKTFRNVQPLLPICAT
jgi:hypothetical protein